MRSQQVGENDARIDIHFQSFKETPELFEEFVNI